MPIVVLGASGRLGHLVVQELLDRGVPADQVVAAGRSKEKLADLAARGVPAAVVDYEDPATLGAALSVGDTVLLISSGALGRQVELHRTVVDAAVRAGAARLIYTSALNADTRWLLTPEHLGTEEAVRHSGLPWTLLRMGWYTENYAPALAQAQVSGVLLDSVGDGRVASATRADLAAGVAAVLATDGHDGAVYEFSGDTAWTYDDLAAAFAEVLDRDVVRRAVTSDEHAAALTEAGVDEANAGFAVALNAAIRNGALALQTGDLARLAGRSSTPLADGLRAVAPGTV